MPIPKKIDLKERLARYRQINLSVTGRKSGKVISVPVWFILDGEKLYLLPVRGSDTQWYQNVHKNRRFGLMRGEQKRNPDQFPSRMLGL